jgi:hypothetical protein
MYVIEKWNGLMCNGYTHIVAGFSTLEEANIWCHQQSPTNDYGELMDMKKAFDIYRVEGKTVTLIPYPWENK